MSVSHRTVADGVARIEWERLPADFWTAVESLQAEVARALRTHARVEAYVPPGDQHAHRTVTWAGLRREGVLRGLVDGPGGREDRLVFGRLADDLPHTEPEGFRALLNSFLPRKRAIAQMLARDRQGRVLVCQLTYKRDWDLPGGVVEVGESPRLAAAREVAEELGLQVPPGRLLLTDWLPPWSGWDDAVLLVFDGGVHDAGVLDAVVRQQREIKAVDWLDPDQVAERCSSITARRVVSALANLEGGGPAYVEGGA